MKSGCDKFCTKGRSFCTSYLKTTCLKEKSGFQSGEADSALSGSKYFPPDDRKDIFQSR